MKLGIDTLLESQRECLSGKRLGIFAHQASRNAETVHTITRLSHDKEWEVTALFGPEHGIDTKAQDMEAVGSTSDPESKIPVFSLYGSDFASLSPTREMIDLIDTLVIDLQDIGSRYYTYIWTAVLAMRACAVHKKEVIICDRPNPLDGLTIEGGEIQKGFESFVGLHSIPVRHGLTIGEIARLVNKREKIGCELTVIPMEGWKRAMRWPDTGLQWTNPSPNMRSYHAALLYPGLCLVEGSNCSEGRGTETPFEIIGAPYIRSEELIEMLNELELPGIAMEPCSFTPTFQKWKGERCEGIHWHVTDEDAFRPYLNGLALLWVLHRLYKTKGFEWRTEPYEFVREIPAIDLLTGSDAFRKRISTGDFQEIVPLADPSPTFIEERQAYLLY